MMPNPDTRDEKSAPSSEWQAGYETAKAEAERRVQELEIALTRFMAVSELPGTRAELSDETEKAKSFARTALEAARKQP